jgi:hypothetical protein
MKFLARIGVIVVLGGLGTWLWLVFHPAPEKMIRKRLMDVAQNASFTGKEGNIMQMAAAQKLADSFSSDAEIIVDVPNVQKINFEGRDGILQAAVRARTVVDSVKIEFLDLNVTLAPDKKTAEVELTAKIISPGERDFVPQELKFSMKESDGQWLITRVETVRVLN